ncbi:CDP-glycerol glycerophosphotransferase family protein [Methanobrevibacter sp.]|uniref:bifunctional glycosyltransferase/CDP-glycerol:glycerophosphate glycerophosphotransferase n=1 Tax=Methanobrevibacter sp. TaxID=66852 RepID=UPI00386947A2
MSFKIAVVMPAYNSEKYISKALDSIINQSLDFKKNIQIIIVNDASFDNTAQIAERYQRKYPKNITVINNEINKGPSYSRNIGLKDVDAEFVNFLDSDDYISKHAFKKAYIFLKKNPDVDIASIPIYFFGVKHGPHNLNFKFDKTQAVDLNEHPEYIQLSAPSSFFRYDKLKNYKFNEDLRVSEDPLLINQMLLDNPKIGFLHGVKYHYRKNVSQDSLIATSTHYKSYFTSRVDQYFMGLLNYALDGEGKIPKFIQHVLMYDLQWIVEIRFIDRLLNQKEIDELYDKIFYILNHIDKDVIYSQFSISNELKHHLVLLKDYGTAYRLNKDDFQDDVDLNTVYIDNFEFLNKNEVYISGILTNLIKEMKIFAVVDGKIFETTELSYPQRDNYSLNFNYAYNHCFEVVLPVSNNMKIEFKANNAVLQIDYNHTSRLTRTSKYKLGKDYLAIDRDNYIEITDKTIKKCIRLENEVLNKILKEKKQGWRTGVFLRLRYFLLYYFLKNKHIWVFMDLPNMAEDNGFFLFKKAMVSDKLKDIKKFYVFSKSANSSSDLSEIDRIYVSGSKLNKLKNFLGLDDSSEEYDEISKTGSVLPYKSLKHRFYLLFADYIITSHPDNSIIYPFWGNYSHLSGLARSKTVFLQHGVTKDDISYWLNRYDKRIFLIVTVSDKERESFLGSNYGYPEEFVKVLGFPRFDFLEKLEDKREIVFMPSWRRQYNQLRKEEFIQTNYYKAINNLLNDNDLIEFLKLKGYRLIFKPHRNVLKFINLFNIPSNVQLGTDISYNDIFNHSSLIITDYSSVAFDFAYLKKPVIYYQPDKDYHFDIDSAYFKYDSMGFGPVIDTHDELKQKIFELVENKCPMDEIYEKRVDDFFKYIDKNNSERVIDAILEFDKNFYY